MGNKPDIQERFHNLSISIWKPEGQRSPSCQVQRGYKLRGMDKPENETIRCFCSDLVAFRDMLNRAIELMEKDGSYPLTFDGKE